MSRAASPSLDPDSCPRCSAAVEPEQEYCLECGSRLPLARGVLPSLAGAWRARVPWYPGDWVWTALLLLVVAGAAAAVAVLATEDAETRPLALVATFDRPAPPKERARQATSTPAPAERPRRTGGPSTTQTKPRRKPVLVEWPTGQSAYTVVLASLPSTAGAARARRIARRASRAGLPDVGFLDSSKYPSLHPGYFVIFTGVYESADDAASALGEAHRLGFPRAYTRQIVA